MCLSIVGKINNMECELMRLVDQSDMVPFALSFYFIHWGRELKACYKLGMLFGPLDFNFCLSYSNFQVHIIISTLGRVDLL